MNKKTLKRFWNKVEKTKTCWNWTAGRFGKQGYGSFKLNGKNFGAHRVSYQIHFGIITLHRGIGKSVLHRCDNKICVRPSHLFLGTLADNNRDRALKGRNADVRGEKHPMCKLTKSEVELIKKAYSLGGIFQKELAFRFGVSRQQIGRIITGLRWATT